MMLALLQVAPTTDEIQKLVELQSKFGTDMVISASLIALGLVFSTLLILYWRQRSTQDLKEKSQRAAISLEETRMRLEEERENNRLMREQQSEMFKHILNGNGDKNQPSLRMLVDSVNALNEQVHAHLAGERPMVDCRDWITSEVSRIVEKSLKGMEARIAEIVRLAERTRDEVREMLRDAERKIDAAAVLAQQKVLAEADRVASQLASNGHD
jgi:uncharacterized protein HemX